MMLQIWVWALTAVLGLWSLLCLIRRPFAKQPGETARFRQPLTMAILSAVLQVLMVLMTLGSLRCGNAGLAIFALALQGLCAVLVTEMCLHVICMTETGFTVRTFFGRVHEVVWADMEYATGGRAGINCIVTAQGRFHVDFPAKENALFLAAVNRGRTAGGKGLQGRDGQKTYGNLPVRRASLDPFDGHVQDWGGMIFAYALVLAVGLGMIGLCAYKALTPYTAENTQRVEVSFHRWSEVDADRINFYDAEGMVYRASYNVEGMAPVKAACGTDAVFTAQVRLARPDDSPDYYRIFALIGADGTPYMTFDHANAEECRTWGSVGGLFAAFTALWVVYIVRSVQVGRNPERYSRKTIRRYFKDGYVR